MVHSAELVLEVFQAISLRDAERLIGLCHPDVEFHWPPSLPYGAAPTGLRDELAASAAGPSLVGATPSWQEVWEPLQPTSAERGMDPRVVGTRGDEVVVLWRQRGVDPSGERLDEEVLGLYKVVDSKLAFGQMFYFDPVAVERFLSSAAKQSVSSNT